MPESNRRRLKRLLRNMMKNGLDFTAARSFGVVSLPEAPYRRVIE